MQISKKIDLVVLKGFNLLGPIAGIAVIVGTLSLIFLSSRPQHLPIKYKLIHNNYTFYLESATKPKELEKGLKFRATLPSDRGMLFDFGKPYTNAGFWMHKVNFPLDIIFLNDGMVTKIVNNAPPCPQKPCIIYNAPIATHVLELPSGTAKKSNIQIQDQLQILNYDH
ncbi:MAG: DUF192 domain-containing protein (plasmid) [Nodularia sp. CChRGM 3473]